MSVEDKIANKEFVHERVKNLCSPIPRDTLFLKLQEEYFFVHNDNDDDDEELSLLAKK